MKKSELKIGDLVWVPDDSSKYGIVKEIIKYGDERLCHIQYFDPYTKLPMICPDKKCDSKPHTCPIHGRNITFYRTWNSKMTSIDIKRMVKYDMIDKKYLPS